jgi:hypothetical protein
MMWPHMVSSSGAHPLHVASVLLNLYLYWHTTWLVSSLSTCTGILHGSSLPSLLVLVYYMHRLFPLSALGTQPQGYHLNVGIVGAKFLLPTLAEVGERNNATIDPCLSSNNPCLSSNHPCLSVITGWCLMSDTFCTWILSPGRARRCCTHGVSAEDSPELRVHGRTGRDDSVGTCVIL